ncbi:MAG: non-canonical purine NTP pyrophosphatase [Chlamydiales bacterium]|nr:non-canonical purine NTP pyrophosphatase [Chlamydiales bacterium]
MKIHYVTSNIGKFEEAAAVLQGANIELIHTPLTLDELQGTSHQISLHKVQQAYSLLNEPCLIDDISVHCSCLNGLPGPYVRSFLEALGDAGLYNLISHYNDKSCQVVCHIGFAMPNEPPRIFEGVVDGNIVAPRGTRLAHGTSWNAIVQPKGFEKTFAELSLEESSRMSARSLALTQFRNYLIQL